MISWLYIARWTEGQTHEAEDRCGILTVKGWTTEVGAADQILLLEQTVRYLSAVWFCFSNCTIIIGVKCYQTWSLLKKISDVKMEPCPFLGILKKNGLKSADSTDFVFSGKPFPLFSSPQVPG